MVAEVSVVEINGAAGTPTYTTISGAGVSITARYCTTDSYNPGMDNPIPIPSTSAYLNRSYWKTHCLEIQGTFTQVNNIRFYPEQDLGWTVGPDGFVSYGIDAGGDYGMPSGNYEQATGTLGKSGDALTDHTWVDSTGNLYTDFEALSTMEVDADGNTNDTHFFSNCVLTQVVVDSGATSGTMSDKLYTWVYDEIS